MAITALRDLVPTALVQQTLSARILGEAREAGEEATAFWEAFDEQHMDPFNAAIRQGKNKYEFTLEGRGPIKTMFPGLSDSAENVENMQSEIQSRMEQWLAGSGLQVRVAVSLPNRIRTVAITLLKT